MAERSRNPYVGPRPFEREDAQGFFGRDAETSELVSLVFAERIVLLYAASGAGKSSLLRAAVVPELEREGFEVLPVGRFEPGLPEETLDRAVNVCIRSILPSWEPDGSSVTEDDLSTLTLAGFLAARPHPQDAEGFPAPRALVFDQFEELFTLYPGYWRQRQPFFEQLADALEADPLLRVVLAIREDYLAQLDPYATLVPGELRTRVRLERLGREAALEAVIRPVARSGRHYASGVAEKLVADLLRFRVDTGRGETLEIEGEFVEPVQLQVVCQSLWDELPDDTEEITEEHLRSFGDVDEVLRRFYDDAARAAGRDGSVREGRLRRGIEDAFITAAGTRSTVFRGQSSTAELPNAAIDVLEDRHLIRAEFRAGARWYELTHDRFIAPIQSSNVRFRERRARRRRRWALVAVAAAALAALTAFGALAVRSNGGEADAGPPPPGASLTLGAMSANVKKSDWAGTVASSSASKRLGNVVPVSVTATGLRGETLVLTAVPIDAKTRRPVPREGPPQNLGSIPLTTDDVRIPRSVWIALPRANGRFRFRIVIASGGRMLAHADTSAFPKGSSEGASVTRVRITTQGGGSVSGAAGSVCSAVCTNSYTRGTKVLLTAAPDPGRVFTRWSGACTGSGACRFLVTRKPVQVAATFVRAGPIGTSVRGQPILAFEVGDPQSTRKVLVVGCTHGDECGGIPIADALAGEEPSKVDLWIVPELNPDGFAHDTRTNANHVDLNRNFETSPAAASRSPGAPDYPGARPWSEPETVAIRNLIKRLHPAVTIWYFQRTRPPSQGGPPENGVALTSGSQALGDIYTRLVQGKPIGGDNPGSAANWQKEQSPTATSFFVELPYGKLSPAEVQRHVRAALAIADRTGVR